MTSEARGHRANDCTNDRSTALAIGAVVLAAGSGSRLAGRPKSLLALDGVPLICRLLAALAAAGVSRVVVVLGHYADTIETVIATAVETTFAPPMFNVAAIQTVTVVRNPAPYEGQASSLRLGLSALADPLDAVIVALADQPLIDAIAVTALIDAFRAARAGSAADVNDELAGGVMVVPRVAGKPGNPVVIDATVRAQWLQGDPNLAGRHWRETHPERVHWFDTNIDAYRVDIDTPEDMARFVAQSKRELVWPN